MDDVVVPKGYALSAGTSTIFMNSSKAFDSPAEWVSGTYDRRFIRGDALYDDARTSGNGYGGGLGPCMPAIPAVVVIATLAAQNPVCGLPTVLTTKEILPTARDSMVFRLC